MKKVFMMLLLAAALLCGCGSMEREYLADLIVPLDNGNEKIVIKEWRWLQGSGAEVYYQAADEQILLGTTTGGDDGYCPFADGKYTVVVENKELLISWCFKGDIWKEKRFEIPEK